MTFSQRAVEAAARAIARTFCDHWFGRDGAATKHKMTRDFVNGSDAWKAEAQAALTVALAVDGVALVPKEPSEAMIIAGCENNPTQWDEGTDDGFAADVANDVYRAMVSAAQNRVGGGN